jgi:hypothetical protein
VLFCVSDDFILHGGGSKFVDLFFIFYFLFVLCVLLVLFFVSSRVLSGETFSVYVCSIFRRGCFVLGAW